MSDAQEASKNSIWASIGSIILAIVIYKITENITGSVVQDCIKDTQRSFEFCRENGVSWPVVYIIYAVAALFGVAGIANFFMHKKVA